MPFTPTAAAQATASLAASNQATLAAPLTAMQTSIANGNLAPAALMDGVLSSVGYQAYLNTALTTQSTTSGTLTSITSSSVTFTAPLTKTYMVHCDIGMFSSGSAGGYVLQLLINGIAGPPVNLYMPAVNFIHGTHLMFPGTMTAGANTIVVQWACSTTTSLNVNSSCLATYIVSG